MIKYTKYILLFIQFINVVIMSYSPLYHSHTVGLLKQSNYHSHVLSNHNHHHDANDLSPQVHSYFNETFNVFHNQTDIQYSTGLLSFADLPAFHIPMKIYSYDLDVHLYYEPDIPLNTVYCFLFYSDSSPPFTTFIG